MLALLWVRGVGALPPGACVGFLSRSREQRVTSTDGSESTGGVAANAALSFFSLLFVAVGFHIHCWRRDFRIQVIKRGRASRRLVVRISLCFFVLFFFSELSEGITGSFLCSAEPSCLQAASEHWVKFFQHVVEMETYKHVQRHLCCENLCCTQPAVVKRKCSKSA